MTTHAPNSQVRIQIEPAVVGRDEFAVMLCLSNAQLDKHLAAGQIGPKPLPIGGRRRLFSVTEIRQWIDAGCPSRVRWISEKRSRSR